ncbi:MAG: hypothetical protein WCO93_12010, partial [bacterium]
MNTIPTNPFKLIESRYWVLNARLLSEDATPEMLHAAIGTFKGTILSEKDFSLDITGHPLDNYTEVTPLLRIRIGAGVVDLLNKRYCEQWKELSLTDLSFYLNDLEILCCYAVFSLEPGLSIKTLEEEGMGLVDIISSLQPDLEAIFHLLEAGNIIRFQSDFVFGVPLPLRKANLHTPDYSYLYTWHIFFPGNREMMQQTVTDYELEQASIPYAGGRVYAGWGLVLWDIPLSTGDPEELIRNIFIDSISGSESVMYDNSIFCFTGFLDMIIRNEQVDSNTLRQICNISHLALQRIKLWKRNLSVEQQGYLEKLRAVMMLEQKKSDFDSAEETLLKAVEGLEVKQSQKSGRIIELVLSFFTALSLYSVANDFYSIMITDGSVKPMNLFSV